MKIVEIKKSDDCIYTIRFKSNFIRRIFGFDDYFEQYKDTGKRYTNGDGSVYIRKDGSELGLNNSIGKAIDNFKRSW